MKRMMAMVLEGVADLKTNRHPLRLMEVPVPSPADDEILIRINVCGVCHTELDEIEGRTPPAFFPIIPGHQATGVVESVGRGARLFRIGDRAGVAWIASSCGKCGYCQTGMENLCPDFKATGRDVNGGYAEFMTIPENFAYTLPDLFSDEEAAPLLCAGAIGYRSLNLANISDGMALGLSGFGGSAHLVLKMALHKFPKIRVVVFARSETERKFAMELGADWAGGHDENPGCLLDAIIDTTPVWSPVFYSLRNLKPGGRVVINAIRKENTDIGILSTISYSEQIWMEKEVKSVANVTRKDVGDFLLLAAEMRIKPEVQIYKLEDACTALMELKERKIRGAKVLRIG